MNPSVAERLHISNTKMHGNGIMSLDSYIRKSSWQPNFDEHVSIKYFPLKEAFKKIGFNNGLILNQTAWMHHVELWKGSLTTFHSRFDSNHFNIQPKLESGFVCCCISYACPSTHTVCHEFRMAHAFGIADGLSAISDGQSFGGNRVNSDYTLLFKLPGWRLG